MKIKVEAESDESRKIQLNLEWELHKVQAESSYQKLKEDAAYAKSHRDTEMFTLDLEKSLPTPVLTTGVAYYKRQLWTYNQGIHDCPKEKGCMHMCDESIASRGSHEVGSCALSHLKEIDSDATNLIIYSDACGGQNRNIYPVCLWLHIVASSEYSITSIDHKFMMSGHSFLPNDRDFGHIEQSRKKTQHIYVPQDWEQVVLRARQKNPFHVYRMKRKDFVSLKPLKDAVINRKTNTQRGKVEWLKIHWISVKKDQPLQFQYRYSNNSLECWKTVDLKRRTKGRPVDMGKIDLPPLYDRPRAINPKKVSDLLELLSLSRQYTMHFIAHLIKKVLKVHAPLNQNLIYLVKTNSEVIIVEPDCCNLYHSAHYYVHFILITTFTSYCTLTSQFTHAYLMTTSYVMRY